jgi:hypothetical protein
MICIWHEAEKVLSNLRKKNATLTNDLFYVTLQIMSKIQLMIVGIIILVFIGAGTFMLAARNSQRTLALITPTPQKSTSFSPTSFVYTTQAVQTSAPTTITPSHQLHTRYLIGNYPQGWSYQLLPNDFFDYPVCSDNVEWNRFTQAGVNDVHIDVCTTQQTNLKTLLETIAPNTDATAHKYTPHTAVSATRFGLQGLKGTWMQGAGGGYVSQYFEIYSKNNHMVLIFPIQGDNQAYENLLNNITLNF